jgi:cytochrome P450
MSIQQKLSLPPGPKGRLRTTMRIIRDPRGCMQEWLKTYGDPYCVHSLNGKVVLTGRADLIRQIFSHDPMEYEVFGAKAAAPILGSGSMLMLAGTEHRRERKLVMPMFHGDRMRAYAGIMRQAAIDAIESQPRDTVFNMIDLTTKVSLDVIVRAIFGGEDAESIRTLTRLGEETMRRTAPILLFSRHTQHRFLGIGPWDRFVKARDQLQAAFDAEIRRRQDQPAAREDILSMLLDAKYEDGTAIELDHVRDELSTFLFAGHETSAIAMAWAIYHLHRNPETLERLRSELSSQSDPSPEELTQLPYLKAVVQETLRMNPVVTEVLRVLKNSMELDGYHLPAGTAVAPATILAHYNEDVFLNADAFQPERFLENNYSSAEYFPFGGGNRRCAGAAFASYEMAIVLGTILSKYEFELLDDKPVASVRRNITMGPSTGIRVRLV